MKDPSLEQRLMLATIDDGEEGVVDLATKSDVASSFRSVATSRHHPTIPEELDEDRALVVVVGGGGGLFSGQATERRSTVGRLHQRRAGKRHPLSLQIRQVK